MARVESETATAAAAAAPNISSAGGNAVPALQPFLYNGQFHFVPQGFEFPSYPLHTLCGTYGSLERCLKI